MLKLLDNDKLHNKSHVSQSSSQHYPWIWLCHRVASPFTIPSLQLGLLSIELLFPLL